MPRDTKVVFEEELLGSRRWNMSSRDYNIFMFEMEFYVTHGSLGFLQVVNCGSPSWTTTEQLNVN